MLCKLSNLSDPRGEEEKLFLKGVLWHTKILIINKIRNEEKKRGRQRVAKQAEELNLFTPDLGLSDSCEVNLLSLSSPVDGMQLQQLKLSTDQLSIGEGGADRMP